MDRALETHIETNQRHLQIALLEGNALEHLKGIYEAMLTLSDEDIRNYKYQTYIPNMTACLLGIKKSYFDDLVNSAKKNNILISIESRSGYHICMRFNDE